MPLNVVHRIDEPGFAPRTATHAEIHNVYGMENSRATYEGLLHLDPDTPSLRPYARHLSAASAMRSHGRVTTPAAGIICA